ncbi:helix-turn-helix domain-containing protein [Sciscionella marina]|uniref:helix-turn-helix transcriptional regulator n=1 Tax=Sciscionella marina TaxID=508770 RepID=UPI00035C63FD
MVFMGTKDEHRRKELGAFLRSRRERITPEQVELPTSGRRRTPGLRREEVAMLAGVGVTWYTWLEQGRDINVSAQVLDAIANTLRLDPHERGHLLTLANAQFGATEKNCQNLPAATQTILDQLQPYPAFVLNPRADILAFNRAYDRLLTPISELPVEDRNSVWLMFTSPAYRAGLPDWGAASRKSVGRFRSAMANHVGEPGWKELVARLKAASPEFAELWESNEVLGNTNLSKEVINPQVGRLRIDYTNMWLTDRGGPRLITYTPADEETRLRLYRLAELDQVRTPA